MRRLWGSSTRRASLHSQISSKKIPAVTASGNKKNVTYDTTPVVHIGTPARGPLTEPDPVLPTHTIDDELFNEEIKQKMVLNTVEEWTVVNKAVGIAHPFHIHINPFQVVEVFDPNSATANDPGPCYADPKAPTTWDPTIRKPACTALPEPLVWLGTSGNTCGQQEEVGLEGPHAGM